MKSLNTFNQNKQKPAQPYANRAAGITLIETILVIAVMSITLSLGLFVNVNEYRGNTFRSSRDLLIVSLQHARSQAMNNICLGTRCSDGKPHGVHINADNNNYVISYVMFQGESYDLADPLNSLIDVSENISRNISLLSGSVLDIYFEQLSGNSTPAELTLSSGVESSVITINPEGRITWTN